MLSNTWKILLSGFFSSFILFSVLPVYADNTEDIKWDNSLTLPSINGQANPGIAGAFSGFIGDYLVIAGGANFPEATPWEGGVKKWWSTLYYIDPNSIRPNKKDARWTVMEDALPYSLGYGVAIELPEGLLCIGGNDAEKCYKEVFLIKIDTGRVIIDNEWPSLPVPLSNMTGTLSGNKIYIMGGQEKSTGGKATNHFFMLDLLNRNKGWEILPSWPGPARIFAVSAAQSNGFDNCIYLFSGRDVDDSTGYLEILHDGWEYNPRLMSWKKIDRQFPLTAGSAISTGVNHILLFGGVTEMIPGSGQHPGFDNTVRLFHTITQTLIEKEISPFPVPVTMQTIKKGNKFYFPSGELKPGIRTPVVISGEITSPRKGLGVMNTIVIAIYFLSLAWIGFHFSKKQKNTDDYFKGGGRLPWWTVGLSIFGTSLSAITFMAIPAKAYATDWSYMLFNAG
ncbi:MAG: sodium:solute symporter, partial [Tannerella sp.]|nr:sodium:solute symporter [Tannerella sp.]